MKVENVGNKKAWIALFSAFGVLIVGLIIAIVVVLATRGNEAPSEPISYDSPEKEVLNKYYLISSEISEETANWDYDPDGVLNLYLQKMRETEDEKVRLLLNKDYYYMMSVFEEGNDVKQHVIEGLIEIDNKLQMVDTALMIVNRAEYYGDEELKNKYNDIVNKRINASEKEVETTMDEEDEQDEE